jgi:hypothetical protein
LPALPRIRSRGDALASEEEEEGEEEEAGFDGEGEVGEGEEGDGGVDPNLKEKMCFRKRREVSRNTLWLEATKAAK